jgi:hypothetical protein
MLQSGSSETRVNFYQAKRCYTGDKNYCRLAYLYQIPLTVTGQSYKRTMRVHDFLLTQEVRSFRARHKTSVVNNILLAAANVAACVSDPAGHVTAMLNRDLGKP